MLKTEIKAIYFADVNVEFVGRPDLVEKSCNELTERVMAIAHRYDLTITTNRHLPRVVFEIANGVNNQRFMRAMVRIERVVEQTRNAMLVQTAKS